jgi:hypothetical protein
MNSHSELDLALLLSFRDIPLRPWGGRNITLVASSNRQALLADTRARLAALHADAPFTSTPSPLAAAFGGRRLVADRLVPPRQDLLEVLQHVEAPADHVLLEPVSLVPRE